MVGSLKNSVCFDYSHNNTLTIESPSYSDFTQFLFGSSYQLGKIQAGFSSDKIQKYRLIVIGGPRESRFTSTEIRALVQFVQLGGNLLIINDEGGDYGTNCNLSDLTKYFGFEYNSDIILDSVHFHNQQNRIVVSDFEPHRVTRNVDAIVQSSACSISINPVIEADENIRILALAKTSVNSFRTHWDGKSWIQEEDAPRSVEAVCSYFHKGRVIGLCTVSMFSSLSSAYGLYAMNNQEFLTSIFQFLVEPPGSTQLKEEQKLINIPINYNLFLWMEQLVQEKTWRQISDIVNFAVKILKDDYITIIASSEERRKQLKKERKKQLLELLQGEKQGTEARARARDMVRLSQENQILNLAGFDFDNDIPVEIESIMANLSDITKGKVGSDFKIQDLESLRKEMSTSPSPSPKIPKPDISDEENLASIESQILQLSESEDDPDPIDKESPEKEGKSIKQRADEALDAALKSLDSFDDFSKKLKDFTHLTDEDDPIE
ncbi:MAG: Gldg family protein [Promethearchaeota archaeon]